MKSTLVAALICLLIPACRNSSVGKMSMVLIVNGKVVSLCPSDSELDFCKFVPSPFGRGVGGEGMGKSRKQVKA
ncbi:MAG: hypothetical protein JXB10_18125, partial [Pirellulales bacterium]|nr:hypothetical protein [Pirellulales bacterium]